MYIYSKIKEIIYAKYLEQTYYSKCYTLILLSSSSSLLLCQKE